MSATGEVEVLDKRLGLFDVYAICVGAMFASGFFFLPGIASASAGPSVVVAYGVSALLMLPALYSIAELSSAMPRAGGAYFFIHRSLGPWAGMMGGIGLWLTLVLKSAFALVGMGAYLVLLVDLPIVPVAVALTVAFGLINTLGAKETAWLQNALVVVLVPTMVFYVVQGVAHIGGTGFGTVHEQQFTPFLPFGTLGLVSTVGLVSISYAGLTKIASAAEEVRDLDRNLPLGMLLALLTAGGIYVGGVYVMVGTLDPEALRGDLTPVATAGEAFLEWLPGELGLFLVVAAAIAAFASTGNAGILAASRYPLAMARDDLAWTRFERIGRFGTPTAGIAITCGTMIAAILFLDVERLAKLGSAFILLTFAMINLAVIILRESRIETYAPGYRSPLYPWMQVVGIVTMLAIIATLGWFALAFVVTILALATVWYRFYARGRVARRGAVFELMTRLGRLGDPGVDHELWLLLQERGTAEQDAFEHLVTGALTIDLTSPRSLREVLDRVAGALTSQLELPQDRVGALLEGTLDDAVTPVGSRAALFEAVLPALDDPVLVLVRARDGVRVGGRDYPGGEADPTGRSADRLTSRSRVDALVFLLGAPDAMTQHLRILAELATQVEEPGFSQRWSDAADEHALKEVLLRRGWFVSVELRAGGAAQELIGRCISEVRWPGRALVALVRRDDRAIFPHGGTRLQAGDRLTVIGPPEAIDELYDRYAED